VFPVRFVLDRRLARHMADEAELTWAYSLPLSQWSPVGSDRIVAIAPAVVSGRRLPAGLV